MRAPFLLKQRRGCACELSVDSIRTIAVIGAVAEYKKLDVIKRERFTAASHFYGVTSSFELRGVAGVGFLHLVTNNTRGWINEEDTTGT